MIKTEKYKKLLYRRSFKQSKPITTQTDHPVWFSNIACYGEEDSYGPIVSTYASERSLCLIPLHTMKLRKELYEHIKKDINGTARDKHVKLNHLEFLLNPDEQYSGGISNKSLHKILKKIFLSDGIDGTIIDETKADELCCGISEIVLWNFPLNKL